MFYSLLNSLSTIVIFQLLLLTLFLFNSRKGKPLSNRLLAAFFLLLAINLSDGLLVYYGFYQRFPQLAHLEDGFVFLLGPALYFYTRSMAYSHFRFRVKDLVHLMPFILFTISFQIFYHLQPSDFQQVIQSAVRQQQLPMGFYFSIIAIYAHVGIYLVFAYREIISYQQQLQEKFSHLGKRNLDWLLFVVLSVGVILILSFIYTLLPLATRKWFDGGLMVVMGFIFIFTNVIVWRALKQPEIFLGAEEELMKKKYAGSTLSETERKDGLAKLELLLASSKVFLNADITIEQLAESINLPSRKVSQIINENYKQNFFDFINSLRIQEAQRIMQESTDPKLTVLEIMYQSGFNSKSSFNTLFKKKTGQTPSEYRKHLK